MSKPILKIKNLNVEYPLFGGILQREVSCVHAVKNLSIEIDKYGNAAQPLYVIINSDEKVLSGPIGKCSEDKFYQFLQAGLYK